MANIPVAGTLAAAGTFPLADDGDIEGGLHVVADVTARDAIPDERKKIGMLVVVQSPLTVYQLTSTGPDVYVEFTSGSSGIPSDTDPLPITDDPDPGVSTDYSRADHVHEDRDMSITPDVYTNPTVTMDKYGRVNDIENGPSAYALFNSEVDGLLAHSTDVIAEAGNYQVGTEFSCIREGMSLLGIRFYYGALAGTIKCSLWDSTDTRVDFATVDTTGVAGEFTATFTSPIAIDPFKVYRISIWNTAGNVSIYALSKANWDSYGGTNPVTINNVECGLGYFRGAGCYNVANDGDTVPLSQDLVEIFGIEPIFSIVEVNSLKGTAGVDGESFVWRGVYDNGTTYAINDVVSFTDGDTSTYIATAPTTGNDPPNPSFWDLFTSGGTVPSNDTPEPVGDTPDPGVSTDYSRKDHVHEDMDRGITPGLYTNPNLTMDKYGGVTSISSGTSSFSIFVSEVDYAVEVPADTVFYGSGDYTTGTQFAVSKSGMVVTGVRFYWHASVDTVRVSLWDIDNNRMAYTDVVTSGTAGSFLGVFSVPQPLTLGTLYKVSTWNSGNLGFNYILASLYNAHSNGTLLPGIPIVNAICGPGYYRGQGAYNAGVDGDTAPGAFDSTTLYLVEPYFA